MADGSQKPIEDVEIGDLVLATDPETGETAPERVTDLIIGEGMKSLVDVGIDPDGDGELDWITATDAHPFWVSDRGWTDAADLRIRDHLVGDNGERVEVVGLDRYSAIEVVHNLTVERIHTYYVYAGEHEVLVHNCAVGRSGAFNQAKQALGIPRTQQPWGQLRGYYDKAGNWRRDGRTYFFDRNRSITEHFGEVGQPPHFHIREGGNPHFNYRR